MQVLMDRRFVLMPNELSRKPRSFSACFNYPTRASLFYQFSTGDTFVSYTCAPAKEIFCARKTRPPNWGVCFPVSDTAEKSLTPHKALYFSQPDLSTNWPVFFYGMSARRRCVCSFDVRPIYHQPPPRARFFPGNRHRDGNSSLGLQQKNTPNKCIDHTVCVCVCVHVRDSIAQKLIKLVAP
jgi:hypothetical protein